ncbi:MULTISPECIES: hypothetical protein [unclassified Agarivorans]|uniref:hypothetical protein n=1 Tax=unclassified Agarivorans TaxID=2636026 RepID=UPI0026E47CD3|nr:MULTISPECIES: hypothetical protein [unclassified Agarivorans]MDO6687996.1 hypothetical protein [Agarivorans sp. 3_MG-2023]MDO6717587.1 hypothetical protein [Agarivorans sp. 2_MG-2023]
MSVLSPNSVFTSLQQDGPFAVSRDAVTVHPFSGQVRTWVKRLQQDSNNVSKYRALRSQIFEFLGIDSFQQIQTLITDTEQRKQRSERALFLLGNMFGINGNLNEIENRIDEYARTADAVIHSIKGKILSPYASHIENTNEIEVTNNPVELLLIMFNDEYHKKARFEARRKLILMTLAGSIEQRERETEIEEKFSAFLAFLNGYVWSSELKIGELDPVYLHSKHRAEDYACSEVSVLNPQQAKLVQGNRFEKLTLLKRRSITVGERKTPVYVSIRKKPPEAKVLKLLRKNQKNPAVAVDDELGLMAVLDSVSDIKTFQKHLTRSASQANSLMVLEDISDTLTDRTEYRGSAVGSSNKTPMMKFFARLGGMRVEFIIHTNRTWLNYMYQQDVAHNEYEVKRMFDTGVIELLFPMDIFHLNHRKTRDEMIQFFRKQIEA